MGEGTLESSALRILDASSRMSMRGATLPSVKRLSKLLVRPAHSHKSFLRLTTVLNTPSTPVS